MAISAYLSRSSRESIEAAIYEAQVRDGFPPLAVTIDVFDDVFELAMQRNPRKTTTSGLLEQQRLFHAKRSEAADSDS